MEFKFLETSVPEFSMPIDCRLTFSDYLGTVNTPNGMFDMYCSLWGGKTQIFLVNNTEVLDYAGIYHALGDKEDILTIVGNIRAHYKGWEISRRIHVKYHEYITRCILCNKEMEVAPGILPGTTVTPTENSIRARESIARAKEALGIKK